MKKRLKLVSVASEVDPFSKTGGLAEVSRSLSKALFYLGHDLAVITPFYEKIISPRKFNLKLIKKNLKVEIDRKNRLSINLWQGELARDDKSKRSLPIYFLGNKKYFSRRRTLYGSSHENARFLLFDLATLATLKFLNFEPDLIQCHDWHAALIPYLLKRDQRFNRDHFYKNIATVFTVHNLVFQFGKNWWELPPEKRDDGRAPLPSFKSQALENINFAKRGILNADLINTVSEQYASEILTRNFGEDLQIILKNRRDRLFGIVNGIDYRAYNPATDPGLFKKFDLEHLDKKDQNKLFLQKYYRLTVDKTIPLIGLTSRITEQKGFELLKNIIDILIHLGPQLIIMGDGDARYINFFKKISKSYPQRFRIVPFDQKRETSVYAGADFLLLPSRFEPCGINQLIALRYGCIPIVHHIGGLAETVSDYDPENNQGIGFVFKKYNSYDFLVAIVRALVLYKHKHKKTWQTLIRRGMKQSFSWELPARKYLDLFKKALKLKSSQ